MTKPKPYIGVTGFTLPVEVRGVLAVLNGTTHSLMIGVCAGYQSHRDIPVADAFQKKIAPEDMIPKIFSPYPGCLNIIHYGVSGQQTPAIVAADLIDLHNIAGSNFHGFQINNLLPEQTSAILMYREFAGEHFRIVMQITEEMLRIYGNHPPAVARRIHLEHDEHGATDVVFDLHPGQTVPLDVDQVREFFREIRKACPNIGLGVHVELTSLQTLDLAPLVREVPDLSISLDGWVPDYLLRLQAWRRGLADAQQLF